MLIVFKLKSNLTKLILVYLRHFHINSIKVENKTQKHRTNVTEVIKEPQ